MKNLLVACLLVLAGASPVIATTSAMILMDNISTTRSGPDRRMSTSTKTVIFQGYSRNGVALTTALPGTISMQCAPYAIGPWLTCKDRGGNAISGTTNAVYDLETAVLFMRYNYTKSRNGSVKAWVLGLE